MKDRILASLAEEPKSRAELANDLGVSTGTEEYFLFTKTLNELEDLRPVNVSRVETKMIPRGSVDIARDRRNGSKGGYVYFCKNDEKALVEKGKLTKTTITVKSDLGDWRGLLSK